MYCYSNTPGCVENSSKTPSRTSKRYSKSSMDNELHARHGCDTMIDLLGEKVSLANKERLRYADGKQKAELQLFGSEQQMSTLQDLSNLLYTRGRLQELGCTFTELGELRTYGDPSSLKEWDQLLRLGPIYDEQWGMFFSTSLPPRNNDESTMWPDLRTLKRVLGNEGVAFGHHHRRLNRASRSDKHLRLCAAYDDLHKLWLAMMTTHTPNCAPTPSEEREDASSDKSIHDRGCFVYEGGEHSNAASKYQVVSMEKPDNMQCPTKARKDRPQNIGWRFSDDIATVAAAQYRTSSDYDIYRRFEEDLQFAISVPLPTPELNPPRGSFPTRPHKLKTSVNPPTVGTSLPSPTGLRHGPSPLHVSCGFCCANKSERLMYTQNVSTTSITVRYEETVNPQGDNLKLGTKSFPTAGSISNTKETVETVRTQKRSIKGWWRNVFSKSSKTDSQSSVQLGGGWW
jgi:hypothetical protein